MMNFSYKNFIVFLLAICFCFIFLAVSAPLDYAQSEDYGLKETAEKAFGKESEVLKKTDLSDLIGTIIGVILSFVGVGFLILIIYGGFTWMLARGNEQDVAKAKNIIINALYGIIIVLGAYAITWTVFNIIIPA